MQKKLFRILSVFLAVVIISVCFMQPIAYANSAVIGGALVVLVAGLLITCGMVFANQAQAEAVASHTISQMPSDLLETLSGFIGGGDPNDNNSKYSLSKLNLTTVVTLPFSVYFAFKSWYDAHFGVSEETFTGDGGAAGAINYSSLLYLDVSSICGEIVPLNLFIEKQHTDDMNLKQIDNSDGKIYDYFTITCTTGGALSVIHSSFPLSFSVGYWGDINLIVYSPFHHDYLDVFNSKWNYYTYSSYSHFLFGGEFVYSNHDIRNLSNGTVLYSTANNLPLIEGELVLDANGSGKIELSEGAWAYFHDYENDTITYALASEIDEMFDKKYSEVIGDYSLDNWDYRKDLEALQVLYDGVCSDLDRLKGYDALLEQSQALQRELDRVREEVAAQGADVIGGVRPLDDAMYDAGLVLQGLRDMIAAQDRDATKIADLEKELEKAKDAIRDLTKDKNIDVPIDPPITATGINWAPLASIKGFTGVFPFCIPFDIINMISSLNATPKAPVFKIPFEIKGLFSEEIVVDLSVLNPIIPFVRLFILLAFAIALARFSSSVIKW